MTGTVIIGGGVIGLSLAYHLAGRGAGDVILLERNRLTSGTSWHAAGIVGPLRATANMTRLAIAALEVFPKLERETGQSTGFRRTGGYWLARRPERMDELHRIAALGRHFGLQAEIVDTGSVNVPGLDLTGHVGALSVAEDAAVNPVDLCMAYAKAARAGGVEIREGEEVTQILTCNGAASGVLLAGGEQIHADRVALCAGAWSKPLAKRAGLALPLQAVEHMYVVTEPIDGLPDPFPVLRDLDRGIYAKGDAGKLVIGGFEPDAKCWYAFGPEGNRPFLEMGEDWEQFQPFMEATLDLMPRLESTGIQHFMNGPESFSHDTKPLIGEAPDVDGLFVAAGMNSVGVMSSAGIGRALADWMTDGHPPFDLWEVDIARADPAAASEDHLKERMREAVADQFAMHWPYKQPVFGRGLRTSMLHAKWAEKGAVFGVTGGWERGLWYASNEAERRLNYSVTAQAWWPVAEREAAAMERGTVLLDLSPFTKIDVSGRDALGFLQATATANLDVDNGRVVYTPVLNAAGGIEADITVTRVASDRFRLVSGAATRWRDLSLVRSRARAFDVSVEDATEGEAVIGVMGAGSRDLLSELSKADWSCFPFATSQFIRIAGAACHATRLSFVGELGWEIAVESDHATHVFDALVSAGARPMGHNSLDGCRIEKGFKHWGHDLGPDVSPLEAGLNFAIDWSKDFVGKDALLHQKAHGIRRRLCLFDVSGNPLLLHDEPIWENGKVQGLTTSGARGPRTGLALAFGLIDIIPDETLQDTCTRRFEIEVAGGLYPAKVLAKPPFDPTGSRMRQ